MENTPSHRLFTDRLQQLTYALVRDFGLYNRVCTEQLAITGLQRYTLQAFFASVIQEFPEKEREGVIQSLETLNQAIVIRSHPAVGRD